MNRAVLFILGTLFLFASSDAAQAQTRTIVGRVVDARTGRPVSSGTVWVKGTKLRDRLRPDGVFVIRPQVSNRNVVLVIRGGGYPRHEIPVSGDRGAVFIRLTADRVELEPLAFTAGAAAGTVEGERLGVAPATSVLQALQGKVAGMDIQGNSGVPAGDLQLRLRGVNGHGTHGPRPNPKLFFPFTPTPFRGRGGTTRLNIEYSILLNIEN